MGELGGMCTFYLATIGGPVDQQASEGKAHQ
jgi:hypothetical protein